MKKIEIELIDFLSHSIEHYVNRQTEESVNSVRLFILLLIFQFRCLYLKVQADRKTDCASGIFEKQRWFARRREKVVGKVQLHAI